MFTSGFRISDQNKLRITDVATTHLLNLLVPDRVKNISGIDRLFVAPELYAQGPADITNLSDDTRVGGWSWKALRDQHRAMTKNHKDMFWWSNLTLDERHQLEALR